MIYFQPKKCEKMHVNVYCFFVSQDVKVECAMLFPLILNSKPKALKDSPKLVDIVLLGSKN